LRVGVNIPIELFGDYGGSVSAVVINQNLMANNFMWNNFVYSLQNLRKRAFTVFSPHRQINFQFTFPLRGRRKAQLKLPRTSIETAATANI
jgi:hypothetical protein